MSVECSECERDLRGGHANNCTRHPAYRKGMLRAAEIVAKIGDDWKDAGVYQKGYAADYLERAIRAEVGEPGRPERCPRCNSPQPHLHPAMQFEGEIQPCPDPWHAEPKP